MLHYKWLKVTEVHFKAYLIKYKNVCWLFKSPLNYLGAVQCFPFLTCWEENDTERQGGRGTPGLWSGWMTANFIVQWSGEWQDVRCIETLETIHPQVLTMLMQCAVSPGTQSSSRSLIAWMMWFWSIFIQRNSRNRLKNIKTELVFELCRR